MRLPPLLRFALVACVPAFGIAVCWVQADANRPEPSTEWTLESAALSGDMRQVKHFLDAGSDPNSRNNRAATPLAFAAFAGQYDIASLLITRGASPRGPTDVAGRSAIHWSVIGDRPEMVTLLLARGADVNAVTRSGETPLHFAVQVGARDSAAVLIAAGADLWLRDADGVTPLDVALTTGTDTRPTHDIGFDDDDDDTTTPASRDTRANVIGWASRFVRGDW